MHWFLIGIIAIGLLLLLVFANKSENKYEDEQIETINTERPNSPKFYQEDKDIYARYLMTETELDYFYFIESKLPVGYRIFPQVSFNAFLHSDEISIRNQFNRKCCDFLLVRGDSFEPMAVIEVDDPKSHNNKRARESDAKRDEIVAQAGYDTIRIHNDLGFDMVEKIIKEALSKNPL